MLRAVLSIGTNTVRLLVVRDDAAGLTQLEHLQTGTRLGEGLRDGGALAPEAVRRTLEAVGNRPAFGINFDPSHLVPQFLDPAAFLLEFASRVYHVHVKDSRRNLDGRRSILGSHLNFGEVDRGWDFVSPGHGDVDFETVLRALNRIGYEGPLSVEWEDAGMDREWGATEAAEFVRRRDFSPSAVVFDEAFAKR